MTPFKGVSMLKMVLFFAFFLSLNSFAGVIETCRDGKFAAGNDESWYWVDAKISITVSKDVDYSAEIKYSDSYHEVVNAFEVSKETTFSGPHYYMLKLIRVNPADVDHGIYYNFHPEANQDDMSGFSLLVVKAKDGETLAKIFQAGWGIGICK